MNEEIERLARRLADDPRITTGTLRRMLKDIDAETREVLRMGNPVPHAVRKVREVVARACLLRRERESTRTDDAPSSRG